jgi:mycofactocin precursor
MTTKPQIDAPDTGAPDTDDTTSEPEVTADALIEEVSIDGMCGVY